MKNSVKTSVKVGSVKAIKTVIAPIHLGLQVTTNLIKATGDFICDSIAQGEGYIVEQIDGTPREETRELRFEHTNAKMLQAAIKADAIRAKLQSNLNEVKTTAKEHLAVLTDEVKTKSTKVVKQAKALVQPKEDSFPDALAFQSAELRKQLAIVEANQELAPRERNRMLRDINGKLAAIAKLVKVQPATPEQAFGLATA